jgi:hypothetical protein
MACTHSATMAVLSRLGGAHRGDRSVAAMTSAAARLLRAFATQVEALRRLRNGGSQTVRVEHVHVNEGGQAIIGNVRSGTAGEGHPKCGPGFTTFKRRPRRGCVSGASTPRANPEGSQAQDAIGKTEMAVVVPMKSPLRAKQVFACC